jgi:drug/metabolite transporter (DMT)-like permease
MCRVEIDMMPCNIVAGYTAALCEFKFIIRFIEEMTSFVFDLHVVAAVTTDDLPITGDGAIWVYIFLQGLGVLALGFTLITIAPTYIPAPEVSLYTLLETVLGPVWVYLGGYEAPSAYALAGGAILLAALAVHR